MEIIISILILVFSAIVHEVAHGFVADRLGDPTARIMGRLTLDPRKHIDPLLSIVIPFMLFFSGSPILFGGAKPVPVDEFNLKEGRKDIALVALAGPLSNILIAIVAGVILKIVYMQLAFSLASGVIFVLFTIIHINLSLAILNLLPIPPLDGSKIFSLVLPEKQARAFMNFGNAGLVFLFLLLMMPIGGFSLQRLIGNILSFSTNLLLP